MWTMRRERGKETGRGKERRDAGVGGAASRVQRSWKAQRPKVQRNLRGCATQGNAEGFRGLRLQLPADAPPRTLYGPLWTLTLSQGD